MKQQKQKEEFPVNTPKTMVESNMVILCKDYILEDKDPNGDFVAGWMWFVNVAFPIHTENDDIGCPEFIELPSDATDEFIKGATKCQGLVSVFYEHPTQLYLGEMPNDNN